MSYVQQTAPDTGNHETPTDEPNTSTRLDFVSRGWAGTRSFRPVLVITVLMFIVISFTSSDFLTNENIQNLLIDVSVLWVIAMGQSFALLTGQADLSSGAITALIGVFLAKLLGAEVAGGIAIVLALLFGFAIGAFTNGLLIGRMGLSFFVVTLGTFTALSGVITLWSGGNSASISSPAITWLASANVLGVAMPIWVMAGTFILALFIQRRTYFGRNLYAIGGSRTAARLSGIRTERTVVLVFGVLGLAAALGGILSIGLAGADNPQADPSIALQAIAAVLLGGTALSGGAGSVVGTALGVLFLGVLENALDLAGVAAAWQDVVTGVILIVAVATVRSPTGGLVGIKGLNLTRLGRKKAA